MHYSFISMLQKVAVEMQIEIKTLASQIQLSRFILFYFSLYNSQKTTLSKRTNIKMTRILSTIYFP